jgi:hypothetical protein
LNRILVEKRVELLPSFCAAGDEPAIKLFPIAEEPKQAIHQGQVSCWLNRQVKSCSGGSPGAAWIDDDAPGIAPTHRFGDTIECHRMAFSGVGTDEEEGVSQLDIGIAGWRPVAPQREGHATGGAGHAEAAVGIDMVGAEVTFGEFAGKVLRFGGELAGEIEANCARAV